MGRLAITVLGILGAVGISGLIFIGINKLFDLTQSRYSFFSGLVGAISAGVVFGLLWGNRMLDSPEMATLVAVVVGGGVGFALGVVEDRMQRLAIGVVGGAVLGLLAGFMAAETILPSIDPVTTAVGVLVGAGLGLAVWLLGGRDGDIVRNVLVGTALGWLFGAWLAAEFDGTRAGAIIVSLVLGILVGGAIGRRPRPNNVERSEIALSSRKYIFLTPALVFVAAALVIPLGRTIWLGFLTGNPNDLQWNGIENYTKLFSDPDIINFSGFTDMFTSGLFWIAIAVIAAGVVVGGVVGRRLGHSFEASPGSLSLMAGGAALLSFAVFVNIRGTIANNLWWIFSVIIFAVGLGLAVAVLADRAKGENIAKSLIFLPMAISFVGASVIWRLIYVARPAQDQQTGVFNTIWIKIGEWSNSATATVVIAAILGLVIAGLLYLAWRGWQADAQAVVGSSLAVSLMLAWLIYRFVGPGIGGFVVNEATGTVIPDPVLFISGNAPWNNFWMMVVFIWIQTGFAMVIFSAAIKAVPEDLLEAARIDGATESQSFWRVTVPQIFPTIGVVVTTLIVTVLKVFDIPKVMTNGNFGTQVLANEMWERAFTQLDFGLGSAVAVVLFIGVLPVMFINIRRMQRERLG
ncbi:MAG: sugar ABC transporter permease [Acidimicrobiia bacterium]|nr:sugar ABC transporter permease [Acidimicrobiia bacterium]MBT8251013.1 sugar ABC transporter permease [Acidimicrobiia bacterium]NNC42414.1 sugar ABC transporter permease [Acidimicrobiia bacterium]NNL29179.1 sugar ABC transporter permease [Acidimicrobiia bacterium]